MSIEKPLSCIGCPLYEPPLGKHTGFSRPDGNGYVLLVAEALGESEEEKGVALVGKAGYYLFQQLKRVDIEREQFTLFNCIVCRPPKNRLAGESYEQEAIAHCAPNLDKAIADVRARAVAAGKHFTIFTLGKTAIKRIMRWDPKDPIMRKDYRCYPLWSEEYQAWVVAADHPSFLMRGNNHLVPVLQFAAMRALEISEHGVEPVKSDYLLDPAPETFAQWVTDCLNARPEYLACDIETSEKQDLDEEEVAKEADTDYTILRCSFAYRPHEAVSVPWRAEYKPILEELIGSDITKVFHNHLYDCPRILAHMPIGGTIVDSMLAWHVLHTALPKGLGFIAPFYAQQQGLWKHTSSQNPALYNAIDSDVCLQCFLGIKQDLIRNHLWNVFERHIVQLDKVFAYMSKKGVLLDSQMRAEAETKLQDILDIIEIKMNAAVPQEARKLKVFKKTPLAIKNVEKQFIATDGTIADVPGYQGALLATGFVQTEGYKRVRMCPHCHAGDVRAAHFNSIGKTRLRKGETENPCYSFKQPVYAAVLTTLWAKPQQFKISKVSLLGYQKALRHQAIINRNDQSITFDEPAIVRLMKKHPTDPLYPLILEHREVQKLLSTYVGVTKDGMIHGGMPTGADGRIHTTFSHNPSTLRSASQNPNLQNLPRPHSEQDLATIVRNLILAEPGHILTAADYKGIEALLVGYFAEDPGYIRLAKMDVHSFYTAYAIHELDGRVASADLPELSWPDDKLIEHLAWIKSLYKKERNELFKHLVHACLTGDHEVLTRNGWMPISLLDTNTAIAQWKSGNIEFTCPSSITALPYKGNMISLHGRTISAIMTPEHRVPLVNSYGTLKEKQAQELVPTSSLRIPVNGYLVSGSSSSDISWLRLAVAVQADGSWKYGQVKFHFVKARKVERLKDLLKELHVPYKCQPCNCHETGTRFTLDEEAITSMRVWLSKENKTFNLVHLLNTTPEARIAFIDELPWWDGSRSYGISGKQTSYFSTHEQNVLTAQTIAHLVGKQAIVHKETSLRPNSKPLFSVSFNNRRFHSIENKTTQIESIQHSGMVYCPTVESGWFLIRHNGKISVTGNSNFLQGPRGAQEKIFKETHVEYTIYTIKRVMEVYFTLFPAIKKWHMTLLLQAEKDGFLRNPFGYVHRFNKVFDYERVMGKWVKKSGPDANRAIAFLPQSTAAGIIKEAMLRLYLNRFEEAGQYLRLLIHDELLFEVPESKVESVDMIVKEEMERPIPELRLSESYKMGKYLNVATEPKKGKRWGQMQ